MQLEVRHLRLVVAVAEQGTLTRAGQLLHLTQSALSHQLLDLERQLGAPIFQRLGKRMLPTRAGERLLASARETLRALQETEDEVRRIAAGHEAVLRLSTECYTCYHWLPPVMRAFNHRFPKVEMSIVAEATRRPIPALLAGRLDLAIVSEPVRDRRILTTPLFEDELVAVVSPEHPWASRPFVEARDFAGEHLILYAMTISESTLFRQLLMPAGVMPRQLSHIQLTEAILELVKANVGVAALARWAVAPHLAAGSLAAVPLGSAGLRRQWSAAVRQYKSTPLHLAEFTRLLASEPFPAGESRGRGQRVS